MSTFTDTLKSAWEKVYNFVTNEEYNRSVFHVFHDEIDTMKENYTLTQQHSVFVNRYAPLATASIPTNDYRFTNLDGSELSVEEIASVEKKLNTFRENKKAASNNPSLDI